ncbi:hypothetical protein C5B42_05235 [Candidatus Cerribacteria bacterium 'Amazon FNV 2010 28 9']|uniref:Uncharacterized protein n=1 Tax=Candidatus Cerribacteria bacterium 'Amazon FNV 2010 28 9' TaxID=2081795 RepID=A0A317JNI6_9BACT|nr:MAG: hypothetical protein C5B42_05235 [Candidatus Cerribacteria bacterium 'Amazon FNV 2010 28 9']
MDRHPDIKQIPDLFLEQDKVWELLSIQDRAFVIRLASIAEDSSAGTNSAVQIFLKNIKKLREYRFECGIFYYDLSRLLAQRKIAQTGMQANLPASYEQMYGDPGFELTSKDTEAFFDDPTLREALHMKELWDQCWAKGKPVYDPFK